MQLIAKPNFLYNCHNSDVPIKKICNCLKSVHRSQYVALLIFFNRSLNLKNLLSSITSITFSSDEIALDQHHYLHVIHTLWSALDFSMAREIKHKLSFECCCNFSKVLCVCERHATQWGCSLSVNEILPLNSIFPDSLKSKEGIKIKIQWLMPDFH